MSEERRSPVARALVSVSDKTGLIDFVSRLAGLGVEIISTGGTAAYLRDAGMSVRSVSQITGFPEIMDGRVKTLHPSIHGGILADRTKATHMDALMEHHIDPIDMVVVNLYPFAQTAARSDVTLPEAVEQIDIGGPAMIRAAAKNFASVAVLTDPADYDAIAQEMDENGSCLSGTTLMGLARKAFSHTSRYDGMIAEYLGGGRSSRPESVHVALDKIMDLRYGENPHQWAALYREPGDHPGSIADARQLGGKELSYNNIVDLESAWKLAREWEKPFCGIIKHNNPCGAAIGKSLAEAYAKALACDPVSAFGGIVSFSRLLDAETAGELAKLFAEAVVAPGFSQEALAILSEKKNLRIIEVDMPQAPDAEGAAVPADEDSSDRVDIRMIEGGALVQDEDSVFKERSSFQLATARELSDGEWDDLIFAWRVAAHVKSNAIVLARDGATVGIGAGQMSRVDSSHLAVRKAGERVQGTVAASDAFFPFADALEILVDAGAVACAHPGGSIRDDEVTKYAESAGISLVLTGRRHFRH